MTLDEARDRIMKLSGAERLVPDQYLVLIGDHKVAYSLLTLDGIAALWPEGWSWYRDHYRKVWTAYPPRGSVHGAEVFTVPDTGNEIHDRTMLTLAVLEAKSPGGNGTEGPHGG